MSKLGLFQIFTFGAGGGGWIAEALEHVVLFHNVSMFSPIRNNC